MLPGDRVHVLGGDDRGGVGVVVDFAVRGEPRHEDDSRSAGGRDREEDSVKIHSRKVTGRDAVGRVEPFVERGAFEPHLVDARPCRRGKAVDVRRAEQRETRIPHSFAPGSRRVPDVAEPQEGVGGAAASRRRRLESAEDDKDSSGNAVSQCWLHVHSSGYRTTEYLILSLGRSAGGAFSLKKVSSSKLCVSSFTFGLRVTP